MVNEPIGAFRSRLVYRRAMDAAQRVLNNVHLMVMERPMDAAARGLRDAMDAAREEVVRCEAAGLITPSGALEVNEWLAVDLGSAGPAFSLLSFPPALVALGVRPQRVRG